MSITFRAAADSYLATRTRPNSATVYRYREILDQFTDWDHLDLADVGHQLIVEWVQTCIAAGVAPKTISNKHSVLHGVFKHAEQMGWIPLGANPCRLTELPRREITPRADDEDGEEIHFYTREQARLLIDHAADADTADLILVAASTGLRWQELSALKGRDVFDAGVRVRRAWKKYVEDGHTHLRLAEVKTRKGRRTVYMPDGPALRMLNRRAEAAGPDGFLFTSPGGGGGVRPGDRRAWNYNSFREQRWLPTVTRAQAAARAAGLGWPPKDGLHMLRHSYAVWALSDEVPLEHVQDQMGHATISITKDVYGGFVPTARAAAVTRITSLI